MAHHDGGTEVDGGRACLLVTGAPGAGKSTVARGVAGALSRSAVLRGDDVSRLVVSGHVWALGEPADEAARQVRLCNDNLCALATNLMGAGFTPVIDWVVPDADQLATFRTALGSRLRLVVLDPGVDACVERNRRRPPEEQFHFDGHAELVSGMRTGFGGQGWWFDTSTLTPDETVDRVLHESGLRGRLT